MKSLAHCLTIYIYLAVCFGCSSSRETYAIDLVGGNLRGDPYSAEGAEVTGGFTLSVDTSYTAELIRLPDSSLQIVFKDQEPTPTKPVSVTVSCQCVVRAPNKPKGTQCETDASSGGDTAVITCNAVNCTECKAIVKISSTSVVMALNLFDPMQTQLSHDAAC